jgi:hypothetical protein
VALVSTGAMAGKPTGPTEPSGPVTLYCDGQNSYVELDVNGDVRNRLVTMTTFTVTMDDLQIYLTDVRADQDITLTRRPDYANEISGASGLWELQLARQSLNFKLYYPGPTNEIRQLTFGQCSTAGPQI